MTIDAKDAAQKIGPDGDATYVDVRTVAEFTEGRPKGRAINVPIEFTHPTTKEIHPNDAFMLVMQHTLDQGAAIIVGAHNAEDDGTRAARAAERLAEGGFTNVEILSDGFEGWQKAGLPVTGDNRPGVSYVSLLTPARRAKK